MKRNLVVTATLLLFASLASAQELRPPEPTQNPAATYRLFATRNVYTFLKLDTRDGRVWIVQWGMDKAHTFIEPINLKALAPGNSGRFTLYPTTNIYTFLLLDQETGDVWHVQWGAPGERFVLPME